MGTGAPTPFKKCEIWTKMVTHAYNAVPTKKMQLIKLEKLANQDRYYNWYLDLQERLKTSGILGLVMTLVQDPEESRFKGRRDIRKFRTER